GATHAACMAELGHDVLGVDVDETKIERLRRGEVPFYEPGLPEVLLRNVESGRLRFTTDYAEAAEFADLTSSVWERPSGPETSRLTPHTSRTSSPDCRRCWSGTPSWWANRPSPWVRRCGSRGSPTGTSATACTSRWCGI